MVEQVFPSISIGQVPPYRNSFARLPRAQIHKVQPFTFTWVKRTKISRMLTKTKMINFAICPCSPSSTFLTLAFAIKTTNKYKNKNKKKHLNIKSLIFTLFWCLPWGSFDLLRLVSSEYKTPPKFDLF